MPDGELVGDAGDKRRSGSVLAHELGGSLPCARCRYNLKGLSIRTVCPECGTPIRATLLSVLDPLASELRPVYRPRLTAAGLVAWSVAALAAALTVWSMRLGGGRHLPLPEILVLFVALSGFGALALVRPHAGEAAARGGRWALLGVVLYAPLCWVLWRIHAGLDPGMVNPYALDQPPAPERLVLRLIAQGLVVGIALCLRPNARLLAARSLLMRTGRVDRQTLLAVVGVLALAMTGDTLRLIGLNYVGPTRDVFAQAGIIAVLVGSLLFTLGLLGVVIDCIRLDAVIVEPPLSLGQLLAKDDATEKRP